MPVDQKSTTEIRDLTFAERAQHYYRHPTYSLITAEEAYEVARREASAEMLDEIHAMLRTITQASENAGIHPFNEGMAAAETGLFERDCPYPDGTKKRAMWLHGFEVGAEDFGDE